MAFLELKSIRKKYGGLEILKGIDLSLEKGGFLVLVGPSGCGKSTLLNTIAGLEPITSGEICLDGTRINELPPSRRDIAMVFQSYALYPNMSIAENIAFGLEMRGVPRAERQRAVAAVAKTLQIGHLLDRKPGQLSGGQRQRVAMGRALVRNPRVFLFDEPLSNLDAKLRVDMRTEIKRLHQSTHTTIVYVTHDQIEAMTLATKIAVLREGHVQQVGSPAEIYNSPANLFVADFMGSPAMNLIPAAVLETPGGPLLSLSRETGAGAILLPLPPQLSTRLAPDREIIFGIRPEAITDPDGADRTASCLRQIEALVEVVEPRRIGYFRHYPRGGKEIIARMRADCEILPGQKRAFTFNLDKALLFDPATGLRIR